MSDNIWQRSVSRALLRIVQEVGATSPHAFREINLTPIIDAAEDAEREGLADTAIKPQGPNLGAASYGSPSVNSGEPARESCQLPPLDPALVEECLQLFYKHGGGVSSHAGGVSMDAALTHYRERVEVPLREELARAQRAYKNASKCYETRYRIQQKANNDARDEADRLRGELAATIDPTSIEVVPWELDEGQLGVSAKLRNGQSIGWACEMVGSIRERLLKARERLLKASGAAAASDMTHDASPPVNAVYEAENEAWAGASVTLERLAALPPLDPALVEECAAIHWARGWDAAAKFRDVPQPTREAHIDEMRAALTHYRKRVGGPLRELAEQRREALEYERGETRRAADASAFYQREADRLRGELADMEKRKDGAYEERNRVVALLAALYPSKRCRTAIEGWSDDWHGCVYIETPEGQLSWHYHDSQASMFAHVPEGAARWDGHTTEEKYRRVDRLCVNAAPAQRFTQPTDEERRRLIENLRDPLLPISSQACERIATLLEEPTPRKSIGRRWVVCDENGAVVATYYTTTADAYTHARRIKGSVVPCDLVPVEEKP